jgi:hypothetical protein
VAFSYLKKLRVFVLFYSVSEKSTIQWREKGLLRSTVYSSWPAIPYIPGLCSNVLFPCFQADPPDRAGLPEVPVRRGQRRAAAQQDAHLEPGLLLQAEGPQGEEVHHDHGGPGAGAAGVRHRGEEAALLCVGY